MDIIYNSAEDICLANWGVNRKSVFVTYWKPNLAWAYTVSDQRIQYSPSFTYIHKSDSVSQKCNQTVQTP